VLASSMVSLSTATTVSAELQSRISSHTSLAPFNSTYYMPLTLHSKLASIGASTAKWTKQERKMWKRLLDARRVAENLEDVMKDIHKANERFLVRSLREHDGTAPLIPSLDGDHCENGGESRGHSRGCRNHQARCRSYDAECGG
jgi:hypothetical protein